MKNTTFHTLAFFLVLGILLSGLANTSAAQPAADSDNGWISLFDGETLEGWKASENASTFSVQEGKIVANGPRSHLFYVGPVKNHNFRNFEFKAEVMTMPNSNSGIYFHTEYQESGWPAKGYEAQVNNTYDDPRKTGSLYAVDDLKKSPVSDKEWFTMYIKVQDNQITIKVNGETVVDYTEPEKVKRPEGMSGRLLSSGTIALQGHDPGSTVYYRNVMVKPLPK